MNYPRKTATYASSVKDPVTEIAPALVLTPSLCSPATEQAVLGALILSPSRAMGEVSEIFKELNPFYKAEHALLYESLKEMYRNSEPIDLYTLSVALRKLGRIKQVGGDSYLVNLTQKVVSNAHIERHCYILLQYHTKRFLRRLAFELHEQSDSEETDIFDMIDQLQSALDDIGKCVEKKEARDYYPLAMGVMKKISDRKKGVFSGIPCSLDLLNRNLYGWQPSDLIILAARPGMGKSAFALSQGAAAAECGYPTAFFSLEMSKEQLAQRLLSAQSGMSLAKIRHGSLSVDEQLYVAEKISDIPLYIDDTADIDMLALRIKAKKLVREKGVKLIIVDYLQLISSKVTKGSNREQEISKISRSLKALAKELEVPIIALSQLSRAVETRGGGKRPQLSDLRDSGAIEQDADVVLFLYRPEYYDHKQWDERYGMKPCVNEIEVLCEKHRNGELFYNRAQCDLSRMRFKDIEEQRAFR